MIIYKNRNVGYFASNRAEKSEDDIYRLDIIPKYKIFKGRLVDFNTNLPLVNAEVIVNDCNDVIINKVISDSTGNFSFEIMKNDCVQIEILKEGYENEIKNISGFDFMEFRPKLKQKYEINVLDADDHNPIEVVTISCNVEINLMTNNQEIVSFTPPFPGGCELQIKKEGYLVQTLTPDFIFSNSVKTDTILFDKKELIISSVLFNIDSVSGELKILQEAKPAFDQFLKIMKLNPDLIVELGWHTDSRGYDDVNEKLSQNRANFAVNYIVSNGIEKNRIVGKGYEESKLVNKCKNGVQCIEEEHRANRRIEFKIIGFLKL